MFLYSVSRNNDSLFNNNELMNCHKSLMLNVINNIFSGHYWKAFYINCFSHVNSKYLQSVSPIEVNKNRANRECKL